MRFSNWALALLLPLGALAAWSNHARAQAICGDPPVVTDERLKGELDSKATVLSRFLGDLTFKGQVELEKSDVLARYPNADKLRLNQYYMYAVCRFIAESRMTTEKKLELLMNARDAIFNPSSERKNWLRPESFRLTVNGFQVDRNSEYNGTLNFTIENRSGQDLGIGIMTNAATAGGCTGDTNVNGLPTIAPAQAISFASGTIHMSDLTRAPDPARLLKWFPAGGRLSAMIRWYACSGGMRAVTATVPVVLAKGRDVIELSLTSDQR